jgi:hypothetical protein
MDDQILEESNNLLNAVADSCDPKDPIFKDRMAIENMPATEISIKRLANSYEKYKACRLCFGLGVYMGLQYHKLKELEK